MTFRRLSAESPYDPLPYLRNLYPGRGDDELHYWHVLRYVEALRSQGRTSEAVVEGLRQELEVRRL